MSCQTDSSNATPPSPAIAPGAEAIDVRRAAEAVASRWSSHGVDARLAALVPGFDAPFFQAGLAGYSDAAMRLVARRHGAPFCVTEALLDRTLLAGGRGFAKADLGELEDNVPGGADDHPLAGQIMGSDPREMAAAAIKMVEQGRARSDKDYRLLAYEVQGVLPSTHATARAARPQHLRLPGGVQVGFWDPAEAAGPGPSRDRSASVRAALPASASSFEVIDVNLACPVKKVDAKARGGHWLAEPDGAIAILEAVREAVPKEIPCAVKLRRSYDETELARLRAEARRARTDFAALVGLIEAAPMPMWFRGPDGTLQLVNRAYVAAVGAQSAEAAVAGQVELVEPVDGLSASQVAQQAAARDLPVERIVPATIDGQRRTLRVSDLPLGEEGVAGYAVDIEEMEELARTFRAFRDAQRQMLDQLSVGVAQFDAQRRIAFANQPFRRIFGLAPGTLGAKLEFERILTDAREAGRIPEVRDFPAWRREHVAWFASGEPQEEAWPLPDGTHLRVVAQPMPDGGLVLVAEDRTEQLALSSTRDTLLRTRTATFDNLFEALAVFAPDGRLQLWNRTFAGIWGLDAALLDDHPTAESLLQALARNLHEPGKASSIGETIRAATLDRKQRGGRVALADGRTLEFAGVPLPDGNGLLTVLDVTANEQAEAALRERNLALEQADQVKTRFLANMSYEFRTPLTSIGGFAELLQAGVAGELSDQGRDYVEAIIASVARLTAQVENVLDLSQSEAGLLPLSKERVELFALASQVVREREKAVVDGGLSLDLRGSKASGAIGLTCIDPRMHRSMCPPRIIAKLSDEEKKLAPRRAVTVCFPALIRSASTSASAGNGPMPSSPFSDCSHTSIPCST
ncbi:PAS-domain containing protein [Leptolyngbya sp. 15MV]|nr:PAS-domain containing protein [Leptolyngbya sp. 15MV]